MSTLACHSWLYYLWHGCLMNDNWFCRSKLFNLVVNEETFCWRLRTVFISEVTKSVNALSQWSRPLLLLLLLSKAILDRTLVGRACSVDSAVATELDCAILLLNCSANVFHCYNCLDAIFSISRNIYNPWICPCNWRLSWAFLVMPKDLACWQCLFLLR